MAWSERYAEVLQRWDPAAIRAFLTSESTVAAHVFLQLYVSADLSDVALRERWNLAKRVLVDLGTYTWGSKEKRAKFAALTTNPHVLAALQGAVARGGDVTLDMLGVLALDGGPASIDALLPHLDPALVSMDVRLELLKRLRAYAASTPTIQAILGEVDVTLAKRSAASPALELAPIIGLGELSELWFDFYLGSRELNTNRVPLIQGSVVVDSRSASWFDVSLARVEPHRQDDVSTRFTATGLIEDGLGVGRCDLLDLPRWLGEVAAGLGVEFNLGVLRTNLRGARRARLSSWLSGGHLDQRA
jgi:hypothetical protein